VTASGECRPHSTATRAPPLQLAVHAAHAVAAPPRLVGPLLAGRRVRLAAIALLQHLPQQRLLLLRARQRAAQVRTQEANTAACSGWACTRGPPAAPTPAAPAALPCAAAHATQTGVGRWPLKCTAVFCWRNKPCQDFALVTCLLLCSAYGCSSCMQAACIAPHRSLCNRTSGCVRHRSQPKRSERRTTSPRIASLCASMNHRRTALLTTALNGAAGAGLPSAGSATAGGGTAAGGGRAGVRPRAASRFAASSA
jgi:hypothetical protein